MDELKNFADVTRMNVTTISLQRSTEKISSGTLVAMPLLDSVTNELKRRTDHN